MVIILIDLFHSASFGSHFILDFLFGRNPDHSISNFLPLSTALLINLSSFTRMYTFHRMYTFNILHVYIGKAGQRFSKCILHNL